jgi:hypothetical protein
MNRYEYNKWENLMNIKKRHGMSGFAMTLSRAIKLEPKIKLIQDQLLIKEVKNPYFSTSSPMLLISLDQLVIEHGISLFKYHSIDKSN